MIDNQPKIIIASVLKPVSDPRMFEKFAYSLCDKYDVHIIGTPTSKIPQKPKNIYFHAPQNLERLSFGRLFFGRFFWQKLIEIKPDLLIINSPELLFFAFAYKLTSGCRIIYDIRENYFKNLWYQKNYASPWRYFLAILVRSLEFFSRFFVNYYLLAEKSYKDELLFCRNKNTVIENKFATSQFKINSDKNKIETINIVYTGTVSRSYGTIEAIRFVQKMYEINEKIRLLIIGCCSDKKYLNEIQQISDNQSFITLKITKNPTPHHDILTAIQQADFGILSYQSNPSTRKCIPTKIYEFLAFQIPMIIPQNPLWEQLINEHEAGFSIDFQEFNAKKVNQQIQNQVFYPKSVPHSAWSFEAEKLRQIIHRFLF